VRDPWYSRLGRGVQVSGVPDTGYRIPIGCRVSNPEPWRGNIAHPPSPWVDGVLPLWGWLYRVVGGLVLSQIAGSSAERN